MDFGMSDKRLAAAALGVALAAMAGGAMAQEQAAAGTATASVAASAGQRQSPKTSSAASAKAPTHAGAPDQKPQAARKAERPAAKVEGADLDPEDPDAYSMLFYEVCGGGADTPQPPPTGRFWNIALTVRGPDGKDIQLSGIAADGVPATLGSTTLRNYVHGRTVEAGPDGKPQVKTQSAQLCVGDVAEAKVHRLVGGGEAIEVSVESKALDRIDEASGIQVPRLKAASLRILMEGEDGGSGTFETPDGNALSVQARIMPVGTPAAGEKK